MSNTPDRIIRAWIVIRADGTLRVLTRNPAGKLGLDEIAVPLTARIPAAWGRVRAEGIEIQMPEPPVVTDEAAP